MKLTGVVKVINGCCADVLDLYNKLVVVESVVKDIVVWYVVVLKIAAVVVRLQINSG